MAAAKTKKMTNFNKRYASEDEMVNVTDLAHELGLSIKELAEAHGASAKRGEFSFIKFDSQLTPDAAERIRNHVHTMGLARANPPIPSLVEPVQLKKSSFDARYAKEKKDHYQYIHKQGDKWVIVQKGTGKVLSHHDTREKAIAAFKAMMAHKHGNVNLDPSDWRNNYMDLDSDW